MTLLTGDGAGGPDLEDATSPRALLCPHAAGGGCCNLPGLGEPGEPPSCVKHYCQFFRLRFGCGCGVSLATIVAVSIAASIQAFYATVGLAPEHRGEHAGYVIGNIVFVPILFWMSSFWVTEMNMTMSDAFDHPPLTRFRAMLIEILHKVAPELLRKVSSAEVGGMPLARAHQLVDGLCVVVLELVPLCYALTHVLRYRGENWRMPLLAVQGFANGTVLVSFWMGVLYCNMHWLNSILCKHKDLQELVGRLQSRFLGEGLWCPLALEEAPVSEGGEPPPVPGRARTAMNDFQGCPEKRDVPSFFLALGAALLGLLTLGVLFVFDVVGYNGLLTGVLLCCVLMTISANKMFPGYFSISFYSMITLFFLVLLTLNVCLVLPNRPKLKESHMEIFTDRPSQTSFEPTLFPESYPICMMHWGPAAAPELKLSVLDLAVFNIAIYAGNSSLVRTLVSNGFANTHLGFPRITESLEAYDTVGRWGVWTLPIAKVRVLAIRGTQTSGDAITDADIWAAIAVMKFFDRFLPLLHYESPDLVRWFIKALAHHSFVPRTGEVWDPLFEDAASWKRRSDREGYQFIITGHSLGGGLAEAIGALLGVQVLAFSPPGMRYTRAIFGVSSQGLKTTSTVVQPYFDIVPHMDEHVGFKQDIHCHHSSPLACHGMRNAACELFSHCGDPRGRTLQCQA